MDPILFNTILLSPLIFGLILSQFLRMPLKGLQGIYLFLAVANVLVSYFMLGDWLTPVIIAGIGFIVMLIAAGLFGQLVRPGDYMFFQVGVGLFPWLLWGLTAGIIYGIIVILFAVLVALRPKFKNPFFKASKKQ